MGCEFLNLCNIVDNNEQMVMIETKRIRDHTRSIHAGAIFSLASESLNRFLARDIQQKKSLSHKVRFFKPVIGKLTVVTSAEDNLQLTYITRIFNDKLETIAIVKSSILE